jgi:hypothetical protein
MAQDPMVPPSFQVKISAHQLYFPTSGVGIAAVAACTRSFVSRLAISVFLTVLRIALTYFMYTLFVSKSWYASL